MNSGTRLALFGLGLMFLKVILVILSTVAVLALVGFVV